MSGTYIPGYLLREAIAAARIEAARECAEIVMTALTDGCGYDYPTKVAARDAILRKFGIEGK